MNITTVTPATTLITLADAKEHLRVVGTDDDSYITGLVGAATAWAESFLGRALVQRTLLGTMDTFEDPIELPSPPAVSVTSLLYDDEDDVEQTLVEDTDFQFVADDICPTIIPAVGTYFPATSLSSGSVRVTWVAGYGTKDQVPVDIRQGVLIRMSDLFEHRESEIVGVMVMKMPSTTAEKLLWPHRVMY